MTIVPISLQDLRGRLYGKAKAEKDWRFWGLYVHVTKLETLRTAYEVAKKNNGAPGVDGVTFGAIEAAGVEQFLAELQDALVSRTYRPLRNRHVEIPKDGGKVRVLGIPAIRDRVVQGALKLILEPIFEADFCDGSYGYRPQRTAHEAVNRVAQAIVQNKTRVIDVDVAAFFDTVRHDVLLGKVARRVHDGEILHLVKLMLKASGKRGVPQGGVIDEINPILRGWVAYFRIGHASRGFAYVKLWVEQKVRRHMMRARNRGGFGWTRWSTAWLHTGLGLFGDYRVQYRANA